MPWIRVTAFCSLIAVAAIPWTKSTTTCATGALTPAAIRYCLLTHAHLDHAGAAYLLKKVGVTIVAHVNAAEAVAAGDERCCGFLYHKVFTPCEVDLQVQGGDALNLLEVPIEALHFPGHTMGCTAYAFTLSDKRIVVCGDVIGTECRLFRLGRFH